MQKGFSVLEAGQALDVVTDLWRFLEDLIFLSENKINKIRKLKDFTNHTTADMSERTALLNRRTGPPESQVVSFSLVSDPLAD